MTPQWLRRQPGGELLVFFGGWGLGPGIVEGIEGAPNLLFVEDYRAIDLDPALLAGHDAVDFIGYSFGVAAMLHWLAATGHASRRLVAVNGTAYPVNADLGIAPETVAATADGLSPESFAKFARRAGSSHALPALDIAARRAELRTIAARGPAPERRLHRIWICRRDRIIPAGAQHRAWAGQADRVRDLDGPHQPFAPGQTWQEWLA